MKSILVAATAALLGAAAPVFAQAADPSPTLGDWLAREKALGAKGPVDPRSAAFQAHNQEVIAGFTAARAAYDADLAAGRPPSACLPAPGTVQLSSAEIGRWLYARPEADHGRTMNAVIAQYVQERFPCRR